MLQGLRTVIYHAPDLAAATAWYARVVGQAPYFEQPFYVGFNVGGYELGLDPDVSNVTTGNNAIAYWGVNNAQGAWRQLLSLGARAVSAPREVGDGIIVATATDPFGNVIGIIENPHFKHADGG